MRERENLLISYVPRHNYAPERRVSKHKVTEGRAESEVDTSA